MKSLWNAEIKNNKLIITMDLPTILIGSPEMEGFKVIDSEVFGKEIINTLLTEEEDGTTPIHHMMDDVIFSALDNGAEGVEEVEEE